LLFVVSSEDDQSSREVDVGESQREHFATIFAGIERLDDHRAQVWR
jgi:hypothetical protein